MSDSYSNIADFLTCRNVCFFCGEPLGHRITHFLRSFNDLPIISVPIKEDVVVFPFRHTTALFDLQVEGRINIKNNSLTFSIKNSETPALDNTIATNVFLSMLPHVQLYCECRYHYTAVSESFKINQLEFEHGIKPLDFFYESFVIGNLWVQNDYSTRKTNIYTRSDDRASPLTYPIIDWNTMGQQRLLNRIKTLVVWS